MQYFTTLFCLPQVIITLGGTDVDDSLVGIVASVATAPRSGNATLWQVDAASGSVSTIKIAPGDALWSLAVAYTRSTCASWTRERAFLLSLSCQRRAFVLVPNETRTLSLFTRCSIVASSLS